MSDEVIAYLTERCVSDEAVDLPQLSPDLQALAEKSLSDSPADVYRAYEGRYPDSLIAQFVARAIYMKHMSREKARREYCRILPRSGIDFTAARHLPNLP